MTETTPNLDITPQIEAYVEALNKTSQDMNQGHHGTYLFKVTYARAYARVTHTSSSGEGQESAYSFVALTDKKLPLGSILKPKGYGTPTLNFARGNVLGDCKIRSIYGL